MPTVKELTMIDLHPEYLIYQGKPAFAVLPIEEFDHLKHYIEDLQDLLELRQAKAIEGESPTLSMEEMRQRLEKRISYQ